MVWRILLILVILEVVVSIHFEAKKGKVIESPEEIIPIAYDIPEGFESPLIYDNVRDFSNSINKYMVQQFVALCSQGLTKGTAVNILNNLDHTLNLNGLHLSDGQVIVQGNRIILPGEHTTWIIYGQFSPKSEQSGKTLGVLSYELAKNDTSSLNLNFFFQFKANDETSFGAFNAQQTSNIHGGFTKNLSINVAKYHLEEYLEQFEHEKLQSPVIFYEHLNSTILYEKADMQISKSNISVMTNAYFSGFNGTDYYCSTQRYDVIITTPAVQANVTSRLS